MNNSPESTYTENHSNTSLKYTPVNNINIPTVPDQIVKKNIPITNPNISNIVNSSSTSSGTSGGTSSGTSGNNQNNRYGSTTMNMNGNVFPSSNITNTGNHSNSNIYQNYAGGIPTQLVKKNVPMTNPYTITTTTPPIMVENKNLNNEENRRKSILNNNKDINNSIFNKNNNSVFNKTQTQIQNKKLMDLINSDGV